MVYKRIKNKCLTLFNSRKNNKQKLQEIDYTNPDAWDEYDDDEHISRGND